MTYMIAHDEHVVFSGGPAADEYGSPASMTAGEAVTCNSIPVIRAARMTITLFLAADGPFIRAACKMKRSKYNNVTMPCYRHYRK